MGATFTLFGWFGFSPGGRRQSDASESASASPPTTESAQSNANEQAAEGKPSLAGRERVIDRIERD